jgi:hypothetical protein
MSDEEHRIHERIAVLETKLENFQMWVKILIAAAALSSGTDFIGVLAKALSSGGGQ